MLKRLWNDDAGFSYSLEVLLVVTILAIGLVAALASLRSALASELVEAANAITSIDQSFSYTGTLTCNGSTAGSAAIDADDSQTIDFPQDVSPNVIDESPCP